MIAILNMRDFDVDKDPKMQTGILSEMSEECHSFWAEKSKNVDFGLKWLIIVYKIIDTATMTHLALYPPCSIHTFRILVSRG